MKNMAMGTTALSEIFNLSVYFGKKYVGIGIVAVSICLIISDVTEEN